MKQRESEILEFKKFTGEIKEGIISISAMLNKHHHHGVLFYGIKNDGEIVGQDIGAHTTPDISKAIKEHLKYQGFL